MRVKCTLGEEMTMLDSFRGQAVIGVFRCLRGRGNSSHFGFLLMATVLQMLTRGGTESRGSWREVLRDLYSPGCQRVCSCA